MTTAINALSMSEIKQAWLQRHPPVSVEQYQFADTLLRLLSEGNPVSAKRYAEVVMFCKFLNPMAVHVPLWCFNQCLLILLPVSMI